MLRRKLTDRRFAVRAAFAGIVFLLWFLSATALFYFLLPEGALLPAAEARDFETGADPMTATVRIFLFNLISAGMIAAGSAFGKRKSKEQAFLSYGYYALFVLVTINAAVLGTDSFSAGTLPPNLYTRVTGLFRITERAGLPEMAGQLLIACSLYDKYLVMTTGDETATRSFSDLPWTNKEIAGLVTGLLLMLFAAFVEGRAVAGP